MKFRNITVRILCLMMILQGPPLFALDVLEVRAEPDFPAIPDLSEWKAPSADLPAWADLTLWAFPQSGGGGGAANTQPPRVPDADTPSGSRKAFDPASVDFNTNGKSTPRHDPIGRTS